LTPDHFDNLIGSSSAHPNRSRSMCAEVDAQRWFDLLHWLEEKGMKIDEKHLKVKSMRGESGKIQCIYFKSCANTNN
jgi:hypothetical protein